VVAQIVERRTILMRVVYTLVADAMFVTKGNVADDEHRAKFVNLEAHCFLMSHAYERVISNDILGE
jgi:hypothetical protein